MTNCPRPRKDNRIPFSAAIHVEAGTPSVSACDRATEAIRAPSHRAGRRGRTCDTADRRAGPEHGTARRRRYRRHRARGDGVGRRPGLAARFWNATIGRGAPMSRAGPSPSTSPTAPCSVISCRCNRCARPGLHLIGALGPLRRLAMREGLAPSWRSTRRAANARGKPTGRSAATTSRTIGNLYSAFIGPVGTLDGPVPAKVNSQLCL